MTVAYGARLALIAAALVAIASGSFCGPVQAQGSAYAAKPPVVVLPTAVLTPQTIPSSGLAGGACSLSDQGGVAGDPALSAADASDLAVQLTAALAQDLRLNGQSVLGGLSDAPSGALVIASCIVRADPGDSGKRLFGMGMGASVLTVHVQAYRGGQARRELVGEFNTEVRGGNKLPPLGPVGLAVHGIRGHGLTLAADADKLAKLVAQRVIAGQYGP